MNDQLVTTGSSENTLQITIQLPTRLAERVEKYARENGNTVTGVVIEALDTFLRQAGD
jgi:predicted DNA-binding protein